MSKPAPAAIRFWRFVSGGDYHECWTWFGQGNGRGYGKFNVTNTDKMRAHRFAYELMVAPIPAGLDLDHLCRNKMCVNPWHLEPVTPTVNRQRQFEAQRIQRSVA